MGDSLKSDQCVSYRCVAHAVLVVDHLHTTISDGNIITTTGHRSIPTYGLMLSKNISQRKRPHSVQPSLMGFSALSTLLYCTVVSYRNDNFS